MQKPVQVYDVLCLKYTSVQFSLEHEMFVHDVFHFILGWGGHFTVMVENHLFL